MAKPSTSYFEKILLVLVAVLFGIIVAFVTGILVSIAGASLSSTIGICGVGFGGSVSLALLVEKSLGLL